MDECVCPGYVAYKKGPESPSGRSSAKLSAALSENRKKGMETKRKVVRKK